MNVKTEMFRSGEKKFARSAPVFSFLSYLQRHGVPLSDVLDGKSRSFSLVHSAQGHPAKQSEVFRRFSGFHVRRWDGEIVVSFFWFRFGVSCCLVGRGVIVRV